MIEHKDYLPPPKSVIDASDKHVHWDGRFWVRKGKPFSPTPSHRLIGNPKGPLKGWFYDWNARAWMEPGGTTLTAPVAVAPPPAPVRAPVANDNRKEMAMQCGGNKPVTPLEAVLKHPVAPVVGGLLVLLPQFIDPPGRPTYPAGMPPETIADAQATFDENRDRYAQRMQLYRDIGMVLLGYSSVQTLQTLVQPDANARAVAARSAM
jgi:hypothetical protein